MFKLGSQILWADNKVLIYLEYLSVSPFLRIGAPHPLSPQASVPLCYQKGEHTRLRVREWEGPNSDDWRKSLNSLVLCLLCGADCSLKFSHGKVLYSIRHTSNDDIWIVFCWQATCSNDQVPKDGCSEHTSRDSAPSCSSPSSSRAQRYGWSHRIKGHGNEPDFSIFMHKSVRHSFLSQVLKFPNPLVGPILSPIDISKKSSNKKLLYTTSLCFDSFWKKF
jgi:hypothetical protein